jgi:dipeptidyl aminopeptidase/acylaminoacyl peptidase
LPPAFGPAANGSIVFAMDGDVYTADPMTGVSKAIVTSTKTEVQPVYSLDGTRIAFGRADLLFVTGDNGGELTQVTPEPILGLSSWSFSPDGRSIVAFATSDQGPAIVVIPSDGKSDAKLFPVFATCSDGCDGPPQYRPDGSEIMFIGKEPGVANRAVYALDPATSKVRAIVPPSPTMDIHGASWSPDGMHLAYGTVDPTANVTNARTHVVKADGTDDVAVDANRTSIADFGFAWSNDGTRLTISRIYSDDGSVPTRSAIVPIDRSSPGIEIACPAGSPADDCTLDWSWSPDDTILLGTVDTPRAGKTQFLADPATGQIRDAPWTASGHPSWQRVAR